MFRKIRPVGRPLGHKLSEETKNKISASKMGYVHTNKTKKKLSKSLKKYFKTDKGKIQRERSKLFMTSFWSSEEGLFLKEELGQSMTEYYQEHFKDDS